MESSSSTRAGRTPVRFLSHFHLPLLGTSARLPLTTSSIDEAVLADRATGIWVFEEKERHELCRQMEQYVGRTIHSWETLSNHPTSQGPRARRKQRGSQGDCTGYTSRPANLDRHALQCRLADAGRGPAAIVSACRATLANEPTRRSLCVGRIIAATNAGLCGRGLTSCAKCAGPALLRFLGEPETALDA